jgi:hypothetical protein
VKAAIYILRIFIFLQAFIIAFCICSFLIRHILCILPKRLAYIFVHVYIALGDCADISFYSHPLSYFPLVSLFSFASAAPSRISFLLFYCSSSEHQMNERKKQLLLLLPFPKWTCPQSVSQSMDAAVPLYVHFWPSSSAGKEKKEKRNRGTKLARLFFGIFALS